MEENKVVESGENTNGDNTISVEAIKDYISNNLSDNSVIDLVKDINNKFLETEHGKNYLQPKLDSFFSKGLESFKIKTLPTLIEDEISKRNPAETPEQKRIRELEEKITRQELDKNRSNIKAEATKLLSEKGLPVSLADYLYFDTPEGARNAINNLEIDYQMTLNKAVTDKLKTTSKVPTNTNVTEIGDMTKAKLMSMSLKESTEFYNKNPELYKRIMGS
jgi:hypothetical protein